MMKMRRRDVNDLSTSRSLTSRHNFSHFSIFALLSPITLLAFGIKTEVRRSSVPGVFVSHDEARFRALVVHRVGL